MVVEEADGTATDTGTPSPTELDDADMGRRGSGGGFGQVSGMTLSCGRDKGVERTGDSSKPVSAATTIRIGPSCTTEMTTPVPTCTHLTPHTSQQDRLLFEPHLSDSVLSTSPRPSPLFLCCSVHGRLTLSTSVTRSLLRHVVMRRAVKGQYRDSLIHRSTAKVATHSRPVCLCSPILCS